MIGGAAIYAILAADTAVAALVDTRIYPLFQPQALGTLPVVTYRPVSTNPSNTKTGPSVTDWELFQVNSIVDGENPYDAAVDLSGKVRSALDYKTGTFGGINVVHISFEEEQIIWDDESLNQGACMVSQDFKVIVNR